MTKAERPRPAYGGLRAMRETRYLLAMEPSYAPGMSPWTYRQWDDDAMLMSGALMSEVYG